jgi:RHS repeat-associated protein
VTASYNYDPYGRLNTVTAAGQVVESYTYDGFDRISEHTSIDETGGTESTSYSYDPLDRTTSRTDEAGETTDYTYLGLSGEVLNEEIAGQVQKSYQYSPWGKRLSQITHNTDGSQEDAYYGYNPHTDVETLTDETGDTVSTYGYTAYGKNDEAEFTGLDAPDAGTPGDEPYNVYRYNAKRFDVASGTYDMGFRDYNPGINRFLSRDMYTGALADLNLGLSPWTTNRYAFTGGNPISLIELDGHVISDFVDRYNEDVASGVDAAGLCMGEGPYSCSQNYLTYNEQAKEAIGSGVERTFTESLAGVALCIASVICGIVDTGYGLYEAGAAAGGGEYEQAAIASISNICLRARNWCRKFGDELLNKTNKADNAANAATKLNRAGRAYPDVIDPRTGSSIHFPGEGLTKVPTSQRVPWGSKERGAFIKEWYDRGYSTPDGGWSGYDIHHIRPREYGGTNDFDNLVPIPRDVHQQQFNSWWRDY